MVCGDRFPTGLRFKEFITRVLFVVLSFLCVPDDDKKKRGGGASLCNMPGL